MAKVSVIILFYSRLDFLVDAIISVLNQSYKGFGIILVDEIKFL